METSLVIVFILGLSIGSGVALEKVGPYLFFYVSVPLLSAMAVTWILKDFSVPGFDFQFDRLLPAIVHNQAGLVRMAGIGILSGLVLQWGVKGLFRPKDRRKKPQLRKIDGRTPMKRRKYLAILGLPKSAGPRDIMMAWTKLSGQISKDQWPGHPLRRKMDISPQEFKQQIDEAYAWLKSNPQTDATLKKVPLCEPVMSSSDVSVSPSPCDKT